MNAYSQNSRSVHFLLYTYCLGDWPLIFLYNLSPTTRYASLHIQTLSHEIIPNCRHMDPPINYLQYGLTAQSELHVIYLLVSTDSTLTLKHLDCWTKILYL